MTGLKLITFDLDNTLWPVDEVIRQAERTCSAWIAEHHPEASAALTAERIRSVRDRLIGEQPDYLNNLTRLRRDAMAQAFIEAGFAEREARHIAQDAFLVFHEARNKVSFFPGALEVLETLADSYTLGALSNGNADLKQIGIRDLFAFHHSAESIGKRKPEADMFHAALHSAGVSATQAVHVGDHPLEDVDAARQHGFHAVWANLIDLSWPSDLDQPSHYIHNLHELTDLLPLFDD
ncbi:HAD family hydrolase [Alloalcanivorax xenomutans]|jgi:FMN hydrolase / 5-amino-6-(5-phospho-D-ribitylamino)uracil phosphatase|uniref:HAD family hydrolase n=1 Tax=Alloalcanivorax xenomutans TaxID=1094342 RepID=UPI0003B7EB83|nr:HAD family hydrolase [Alloalcanivorax xenomutans]ERS14243.1 HAD family hydrolase [Alcanivorax sp. PN-3]KYZ85380.1 HAD family hydrolase [Alcanivorax sp. KX64203]MBA4722337.1 HAD family hydrolase [Alcanivorax sp.]MCE7525605.1 HAD family hydrolase [Alloalcanivorax xenomutans]PHS70860.1 MAG: HAD family hydrolase [Alcanivorax sp.]